MPAHDACISGTSRVVTVASLQRLKGSSYSSTRRLWSAACDKVFECTEHGTDRKSSSAVLGLWPYTARRSTNLLQEFGREMFNHPLHRLDLSLCDFHLHLTSRNSFSGQHKRFQNDRESETSVTVVSIPGGKLLLHTDTKVGPMVWQMSQLRRSICWKIAQNLLYSCFNKSFH